MQNHLKYHELITRNRDWDGIFTVSIPNMYTIGERAD